MIGKAVLILLVASTLAYGAEDHLETCLKFAWDYAPNENLATFHLFVRADGASYDFAKLPIAVAPGIPTMVLEIACRTIHVSKPGRYFAVVQAYGMHGEVSGPSNEVSFLYGTPDEINPPAPKPPAEPSPEPPPIFYVPPPLMPDPRPPAPPPRTRAGSITASCVWRGVPCD